jgi:hypothetical protein
VQNSLQAGRRVQLLKEILQFRESKIQKLGKELNYFDNDRKLSRKNNKGKLLSLP